MRLVDLADALRKKTLAVAVRLRVMPIDAMMRSDMIVVHQKKSFDQ